MKLNISTHHYETDDKIVEYLQDKIGGLDKFLPRHARESAEADVILTLDVSGREDNQFVCEVVVQVPEDVLVSKEATLNMYAAIDIVEAKLKVQLAKYKAKHSGVSRRARLKRRLVGAPVEDEVESNEVERP